ncbi:hypothetical protein QBC41DRAFT_304545 [Cercophora samala]|uniref:Uncharacterized protein n=1 Tax=Cercophora samala TaxID=330535 RepID=A0AA39ZAF6_9PEZI|nr:hypothetical protein QBC41DRAFT_304545 [Cercophora samala]
MSTPIYPLTLHLTPPFSPSSPPILSLSLPADLSPSQIDTILSGSLRSQAPNQETHSYEPLRVTVPAVSPTTRPSTRFLHLNPQTDVLLLLNLPSITPHLPPHQPISTLLPSLMPFRRIAIPFHPSLTPEALLEIWPHHLQKIEDIYIVVDTAKNPEILRRNREYEPHTIESFVLLEGKGYDVHGDSEDRAWVVGRGEGTGDGLVKGLNELIWRRGVVGGQGWGHVGGWLEPRVALLGLVRE